MKARLGLMTLLLAATAMLGYTHPTRLLAQHDASLALSGLVTSAEEGPMEGVLVTVKKTGAGIATTVVTAARGRYQFPRARLEPGAYAIRIRAVGYDLASAADASIDPARTAVADLKLKKTDNLAAQLTNAE